MRVAHTACFTLLIALSVVCLGNQPAWALDPPQYVLQWGSLGGPDGGFSYPDAVAVDSDGNVYVCEAGNPRIQKFTGDGLFLTTWGAPGSGPGEFSFGAYIPGIAIDDDDNVYVSDGSFSTNLAPRIQKFTTDGVLLGQWDQNVGWDWSPQPCPAVFEGFGTPGPLSARNGLIFVADAYVRIHALTSQGVWAASWGGPSWAGGDPALYIGTPSGIAVDSSGAIYVLTDRVRKYVMPVGCPPWPVSIWSPFTPSGNENGGAGIAIDALDRVYVARPSGTVAVFSTSGEFLTEWGGIGTGDGEFRGGPLAIAFDNEGCIYVTDGGYGTSGRVQKFGYVSPSDVRPKAPGLVLSSSPNPFNGQTTLQFSMPERSNAVLSIYDIGGRKLSSWEWASLSAGPHELQWSGRMADGEVVASGVFFCRLTANGQTVTQKIIHLK